MQNNDDKVKYQIVVLVSQICCSSYNHQVVEWPICDREPPFRSQCAAAERREEVEGGERGWYELEAPGNCTELERKYG